MCIGGIAMLVITNPKLALWVLAAVPVVVAPIIIFGRKVRRLSREAQARVADMVSEGGETLDAVRTVQAFAQEESAGVRFTRATERGVRGGGRAHQPARDMTTFVIFIVFSAVGFLLWMGGQDVHRRAASRPATSRPSSSTPCWWRARAARSARRSATCSAPRAPPSGWPNCARSSR